MRQFWTHDETVDLLVIFNEKNVMGLFDGKRYRNEEIYKMVSTEMLKRGYVDRDERQIENRWKNLKKHFYIAKKKNGRSGEGTATCKYYEELNNILGNRPSASFASSERGFEGVDVAKNLVAETSSTAGPSNASTIEVVSEEIADENNCDENITGQPPAKKHRAKGNYSKTIDRLADKLTKSQAAISKQFAEKQKEIIDYEFKLYQKYDDEQRKRDSQETKELLQSSMQCFFKGMRDLLYPNQTNNEASSSHDISYARSPGQAYPSPSLSPLPPPSTSRGRSTPLLEDDAAEGAGPRLVDFIQQWNDESLDYV